MIRQPRTDVSNPSSGVKQKSLEITLIWPMLLQIGRTREARDRMWTEHTEQWLDAIKRYNSHVLRLRKSKACLLVIDMQNEFLAEDGAVFFHYAQGIVPNIKHLLRVFRGAARPVIFTRHQHENPSVDGGMTAEWWPDIKLGKSLIKGTKGVEIFPALKPRKNERIIPKHRYSAFYNTDLEIVLRGMGVTDLVISGVLTNCCCESTARDAFFRDFRVFFLADATAASEPEFHMASLKNLAYAFAYVTTTDGIIAQMT
jgi:nicotinamidase-related amidase